jgi:hypothetical protein
MPHATASTTCCPCVSCTTHGTHVIITQPTTMKTCAHVQPLKPRMPRKGQPHNSSSQSRAGRQAGRQAHRRRQHLPERATQKSVIARAKAACSPTRPKLRHGLPAALWKTTAHGGIIVWRLALSSRQVPAGGHLWVCQEGKPKDLTALAAVKPPAALQLLANSCAHVHDPSHHQPSQDTSSAATAT